jgi:transposase, IS5 family
MRPKERRESYISGQERCLTGRIKQGLKRRSALESVIGCLKADHRMGQNHLAHAAGGAINAVLAAAGYNFRRLLARLIFLWTCFLDALLGARSSNCRLIAS